MPDRMFEGQHADEKVERLIRRHPVIFIGETLIILILLIIGVIGLVVARGVFDPPAEQIGLAILSFYFFFVWFLYLVFFITYYFDITFLTNERLVEVAQKNLFAREESEVTLDHVQNVTARQTGVLQTVFNFGTVIVETAGEGTGPTGRLAGRQQIFELENIPTPNDTARLITNLHAEHLKGK